MSDDDPFEDLDAPEGREGDPFEHLDEAGPATARDPAMDDGEDSPGKSTSPERAPPGETDDEPAFEEEFIDADDPFEAGGTGAASEDPASGEAGPTDSAQTADPAGGADEPTSPGSDDPFAGMADRGGDPFDEGESTFESVDVDEVDPDEVWESLEEEVATPTGEGSRYVEVSKHRFCEQCEHFASPPVARCTHEDAEIIEYLDMETVKLLDCPVVAEQRRLEDEE